MVTPYPKIKLIIIKKPAKYKFWFCGEGGGMDTRMKSSGRAPAAFLAVPDGTMALARGGNPDGHRR
ncbi:hypothetical protein DXA96_07845 [Lachnospiraceae bacterium OF09-33XD]|nr:hypothetical protein DXA96_07845 [Lachnospiraceae bacterium OF09-33XD]